MTRAALLRYVLFGLNLITWAFTMCGDKVEKRQWVCAIVPDLSCSVCA